MLGVDLDKWLGGHTAIRREAESRPCRVAIPGKHIRNYESHMGVAR